MRRLLFLTMLVLGVIVAPAHAASTAPKVKVPILTHCTKMGKVPAGMVWACPNGRLSVTKFTPPPSEPCNEDHVMDIYIVGQTLFECVCETMPYGAPICDWYEVTSQADDPLRYRKVLAWARVMHLRMTYRSVIVTVRR